MGVKYKAEIPTNKVIGKTILLDFFIVMGLLTKGWDFTVEVKAILVWENIQLIAYVLGLKKEGIEDLGQKLKSSVITFVNDKIDEFKGVVNLKIKEEVEEIVNKSTITKFPPFEINSKPEKIPLPNGEEL